MRWGLSLLVIVLLVAPRRVEAELSDQAQALFELRSLYGAAPTRRNAESLRDVLARIEHRLPAQDAPAVTKQAIAWLERVFAAEPNYTRDHHTCQRSDVPTCLTLGALYSAARRAYAVIALSVKQRGALEPFHRFARRLHRVASEPCEASLSDEQRAVQALVLARYLFDHVSDPISFHDVRCLRVTTLGGPVRFTRGSSSRSLIAIDPPLRLRAGRTAVGAWHGPGELPEVTELARSSPAWQGAPIALIHEHGRSWANVHVLKRVVGEWRLAATPTRSIACE